MFTYILFSIVLIIIVLLFIGLVFAEIEESKLYDSIRDKPIKYESPKERRKRLESKYK